MTVLMRFNDDTLVAYFLVHPVLLAKCRMSMTKLLLAFVYCV